MLVNMTVKKDMNTMYTIFAWFFIYTDGFKFHFHESTWKTNNYIKKSTFILSVPLSVILNLLFLSIKCEKT